MHNELGVGFAEKVYENALKIELEKAGLSTRQQHPIEVNYRGHCVGEFFADLIIEGRLIVELKAVRTILKEFEIQLVNYLAATGVDHGLILNFGPSVQVKRKFREYRRPDVGAS